MTWMVQVYFYPARPSSVRTELYLPHARPDSPKLVMATQFLHSREIAAGQSTTKKTPLPHAAAPPMRLVLRTTVPGPKILDPDFNPQVCGFSFWPGGPEHYEWKALDEIIGKDVELFKEINPTDIRQVGGLTCTSSVPGTVLQCASCPPGLFGNVVYCPWLGSRMAFEAEREAGQGGLIHAR